MGRKKYLANVAKLEALGASETVVWGVGGPLGDVRWEFVSAFNRWNTQSRPNEICQSVFPETLAALHKQFVTVADYTPPPDMSGQPPVPWTFEPLVRPHRGGIPIAGAGIGPEQKNGAL